VGEVDDTRLTSGWVGVNLGAPVDTTTGTFEFDNFEVQAPAYTVTEAPAATAAANLLATEMSLPIFLDNVFSTNAPQFFNEPSQK